MRVRGPDSSLRRRRHCRLGPDERRVSIRLTNSDRVMRVQRLQQGLTNRADGRRRQATPTGSRCPPKVPQAGGSFGTRGGIGAQERGCAKGHACGLRSVAGIADRQDTSSRGSGGSSFPGAGGSRGGSSAPSRWTAGQLSVPIDGLPSRDRRRPDVSDVSPAVLTSHVPSTAAGRIRVVPQAIAGCDAASATISSRIRARAAPYRAHPEPPPRAEGQTRGCDVS